MRERERARVLERRVVATKSDGLDLFFLYLYLYYYYY